MPNFEEDTSEFDLTIQSGYAVDTNAGNSLSDTYLSASECGIQ